MQNRSVSPQAPTTMTRYYPPPPSGSRCPRALLHKLPEGASATGRCLSSHNAVSCHTVLSISGPAPHCGTSRQPWPKRGYFIINAGCFLGPTRPIVSFPTGCVGRMFGLHDQALGCPLDDAMFRIHHCSPPLTAKSSAKARK